MKKLFLFFACIFIIPISSTFAQLECKIKDQTAPPLEQYFTNLDRLSGHFAAQLDGKYSTQAGDVFMVQKKRIQHSFNSMIGWDSYWSTASFYIKYGTSNAYASPVWRDYSLLEQREKNINNLIKTMINRGYAPHNIDIKKLCQKQIPTCEFQEQSSGEIDVYDALGEILKNHQQIMHLYRLNITSDTSVEGNIRETPKYLFVSTEFSDQIREYYNNHTTETCGKDEKESMGFFEKMRESISRSSGAYEQGIETWKRAISKVMGTMDSLEYDRNERELLEQELARQ